MHALMGPLLTAGAPSACQGVVKEASELSPHLPGLGDLGNGRCT